MHHFHPDLIQLCNQQVLQATPQSLFGSSAEFRFESLSTIDRFSGQASLEFVDREYRWQVLIDTPARLPALQEICWHVLDEALRAAAIGLASAPIRRWLENLCGCELRLAQVRLAAQQFEGDLLFTRCSVSEAYAPGYSLAVRAAPQTAWARCLRDTPDTNRTLGSHRPADPSGAMLLVLRCRATAAPLTLQELDSVVAGDYLRLQTFALTLGCHSLFAITINGQQLTVLYPTLPAQKENFMASELALESLGQLELEVSIQMTALPVRVETLCRIGPGYTFIAPCALEGASVGVLVDGQTVGRGRLICIGDVLGVQITHWFGMQRIAATS